jgi:GNAT superfamily N-acetyltransferase
MPPLREGYTLRQARGDDFEAVAALLDELGRDPVTDEVRDDCRAVFRLQVVDPSSHHMVVVDASGAIVAFCALQFRHRLNLPAEEAWIPDLCAGEAARRDGVATALLEEAERLALARGCSRLATESAHQHAEAHEELRRFKMRDSGRHFHKRLGP